MGKNLKNDLQQSSNPDDLLISGEEFRYIREHCGLTRHQVAKHGNLRDGGTIAYWEKKDMLTMLQARTLVNAIKVYLGSDKYYLFMLNKKRSQNS